MFKKITALLSLGLGVFILVQVLMPVLSFKIWEISVYNQNLALVSPDLKNDQVLGVSIEERDSFPAFISSTKRAIPLPYSEFTLDIPSINLKEVKVVVESDDFEKNLAHLPGSVLPGEKGNVFITGHSSLPQLFRPSNFKAIFAHLPEVKKGDQIIIEAGGQKFTYFIEGLKTVDPSQTWVISPPDDKGRYLTLMTCVPPGFYWKRLIVLAKLPD